jgi:hypothetical protein
LTDELLNLPLGIDVERVVVEQGDLVATLALGLLLLTLPHGECFSPGVGVVDSSSEFGILRTEASKLARVT